LSIDQTVKMQSKTLSLRYKFNKNVLYAFLKVVWKRNSRIEALMEFYNLGPALFVEKHLKWFCPSNLV